MIHGDHQDASPRARSDSRNAAIVETSSLPSALSAVCCSALRCGALRIVVRHSTEDNGSCSRISSSSIGRSAATPRPIAGNSRRDRRELASLVSPADECSHSKNSCVGGVEAAWAADSMATSRILSIMIRGLVCISS